MKTYIYMNQRIRDDKPTGPVIRAQKGRRRPQFKESDCFEIRALGRTVARVIYEPKRNPSPTHHVKAWIEVEGAPGIEVVPAAKRRHR